MTAVALWGLVKRFWPAIPCIALLIALMLTRASLTDVKHERDAAKSALTETVANYRAAAAQRKASDLLNVERVNTEAGAISKETINDYQARIADLRADFAERVRRATEANSRGAPGADLSAVPVSAVTANGTSCQAVFPAKDALIASEQTEQLIALQNWVRNVSAINITGLQESAAAPTK